MSDSEEGEAEMSEEASDAEMNSSSDEDEDPKKKQLTGKKGLRAQITQEKMIRAKEAQMRQGEIGEQP